MYQSWIILFFTITLIHGQSFDIRGMVTDSITNNPVPGAIVTLVKLNKKDTTDSQGRFFLANTTNIFVNWQPISGHNLPSIYLNRNSIQLTINNADNVKLHIHNLNGKHIYSLQSHINRGINKIELQPLPDGYYVCTIITNNSSQNFSILSCANYLQQPYSYTKKLQTPDEQKTSISVLSARAFPLDTLRIEKSGYASIQVVLSTYTNTNLLLKLLPVDTNSYTLDMVYEDILYFQNNVHSSEKELFLQNYKAIGKAIYDACKVWFPDIPLKNAVRIFIADCLKESTFFQNEIQEASSAYPTLGLFQIRKSSTVADFNTYGNTKVLFDKGIYYTDPTNPQMMEIEYNTYLALWYISFYARSNGLYPYNYFKEPQKRLPPGTITSGLSCHVIGPTAWMEKQNLQNAQIYVDWIKAKYLELFQKDKQTPDSDYFTQTTEYVPVLEKP
jgi:hypothetical protein